MRRNLRDVRRRIDLRFVRPLRGRELHAAMRRARMRSRWMREFMRHLPLWTDLPDRWHVRMRA